MSELSVLKFKTHGSLNRAHETFLVDWMVDHLLNAAMRIVVRKFNNKVLRNGSQLIDNCILTRDIQHITMSGLAELHDENLRKMFTTVAQIFLANDERLVTTLLLHSLLLLFHTLLQSDSKLAPNLVISRLCGEEIGQRLAKCRISTSIRTVIVIIKVLELAGKQLLEMLDQTNHGFVFLTFRYGTAGAPFHRLAVVGNQKLGYRL